MSIDENRYIYLYRIEKLQGLFLLIASFKMLPA